MGAYPDTAAHEYYCGTCSNVLGSKISHIISKTKVKIKTYYNIIISKLCHNLCERVK